MLEDRGHPLLPWPGGRCSTAPPPSIPAGHKVGLVGRNGTGKTTLFRLIRGELALEGGEIALPRGARIGGVDQEVPSSETSLLDTVLAADRERHALMAEAEHATDGHRIAEVQTRLADIDAWSAEGRAVGDPQGAGVHRGGAGDAVLGLFRRLADAGGAGGRAVRGSPTCCCSTSRRTTSTSRGRCGSRATWRKYPHTVIVISHDRELLNRTVGSILHLEDRKLTLYQGPYDTFAETRAARIAVAEAERSKQEARRAHMQSFVDRFRYKASKAEQAQSRLKMIARMKPITTPQEAALHRFGFPCARGAVAADRRDRRRRGGLRRARRCCGG